MRGRLHLGLLVLLTTRQAGAREIPTQPPLTVPRASGAITLKGDLSDPGWQGAAVIDTFYETAFGDNRAPLVKTVAYLTYDEKYFYVGVRCDDPNPKQIRAPYADRDAVIGTDDNVAIFLDTRGDRRSAQEFRVSPRGIQADGSYNDANGNEDFSPDFFYDTAASITKDGWQAELRIPLSSLRYRKGDAQKWGILIWRNYPRDFRYAIYSSPLPRGSNCTICHARELAGLDDLPSSGHLVVAPYAAGQDVARAPVLGGPLSDEARQGRVGLDVKWNPSADATLDSTINPDFSQIESDVAQIAVNNRFALFFPEKRPFFLEGVDLLDTPIQAVYTRSITSPRWGVRGTGKLGSSSYTVLFAQDKGGGSVILPGPTLSDLAPQDFRSIVGVGRWRRDLGSSFVGFLYSGREIEGGGHNRVFGPDFQWRPSDKDQVTGQALLSDTQTPRRPDLTPQWDGRTLRSHALNLSWFHITNGVDWGAKYLDYGDGFRAENGFVPQVGFREGIGAFGLRYFPAGLFSFVRPAFTVDYTEDRKGDLVSRHVFPSLTLQGRRNLQAELDLNLDRLRTADKVLPRTQLAYTLLVDPSRWLSRVGLTGFLGQDIDVVNVRTGHGGTVTATATVRPTEHLSLDVNDAFSWLDVESAGRSGRLFTSQVQRLKATYNLSARVSLRLIGQYVSTDRDPALYLVPVPARSGNWAGSALFSYRLNWQTALFVGYGDARTLTESRDLVRTDREFFVKASYAFRT
jgi:hypothetical protein